MNDDLLLHAAKDIAIEAGEILLQKLGRLSSIETKTAHWDIVTEADLASEKLIVEMLEDKFPEHDILSEECGLISKGKSSLRWVIDPLDGTTNYSHGLPYFAVSIGLVSHDDFLVGVIYNPFHKELFHAAKGKGAFLNDKPISVSKTSEMAHCLLATGLSHKPRDISEENYIDFHSFTRKSQGVRRLGSAALEMAYIAAGRLDGYWERNLKEWDIAAGCIIVQEAGGLATDHQGSPITASTCNVVAANPWIHEKIIEILNQ